MAKKKQPRTSLRNRQERRRRGEDDLRRLVEEPVPMGSGQHTFGSGPYAYLKTNIFDGSTRVFRFRSHTDALDAMERGVAADRLAESYAC